MSTAHQSALQAKHAHLDQRLHEETLKPQPDAAIVAGLKKQKLKLKEELSGI
jgi:hypothetical protein